jgi:hypothetical protein
VGPVLVVSPQFTVLLRHKRIPDVCRQLSMVSNVLNTAFSDAPALVGSTMFPSMGAQ